MFDKIKKFLDKKNVLILGFGREGRSTLDFLTKYVDCKKITVADKNDLSHLLKEGIEGVFGENYMENLDSYDVIIKSPGIVYENVSPSVIEKTTSQTHLFLMEFRDNTIGITGTKGKSTTTTLIYHILKNSGVDAILTGNIGIPPLDSAPLMKEGSVAVFEMSCHQLEFENISPRRAVILNLFEDHLDHYKTRNNYVKAKENIFLNQDKEDTLFISSDCLEQIEKSPSKVITLGKENADFTYKDETVVSHNGKISIPLDSISLVGEHNLYNVMTAFAVTSDFGVDEKSFISALLTYKSLPHRLEFVATKNGVNYYDDSISTVCQTTIQAIESLKNVTTVLVGGMDRGIDYSELIEYFEKNKIQNIILMYESGKRIAGELLEKNIKHFLVSDLEEAVKLASDLTGEGNTCVLSPAAASYGYFKNFEERGEKFSELVKKL
ncbi:MAG: UDP-N-acetylmuramoyl-L-alanine--D-glutamate ligase [Ruminococcaceae bacterium]|nr:UDP-N-acetylmuramoyl-L-alanine--D-glutamate ligase [Oscillospiraceae bacterium]